MQYVCARRTCGYDVFWAMLLVLGVLCAFLVIGSRHLYDAFFGSASLNLMGVLSHCSLHSAFLVYPFFGIVNLLELLFGR